MIAALHFFIKSITPERGVPKVKSLAPSRLALSCRLARCFLQAKNACICNGRSNGPGSAFLLLATSHKRMANPVTWTVKNNEMTVVH